MAKKHKKRRKGKWVYVGEAVNGLYKIVQYDCSVCGSPQTFGGAIALPYFLYCPICGARMEPRV